MTKPPISSQEVILSLQHVEVDISAQAEVFHQRGDINWTKHECLMAFTETWLDDLVPDCDLNIAVPIVLVHRCPQRIPKLVSREEGVSAFPQSKVPCSGSEVMDALSASVLKMFGRTQRSLSQFNTEKKADK